jgi:ATP-dependent Clp protease ATP-binding subunit ClpA
VFERFHRDARRVVEHARHEAALAGQGQIGCEHLLLGLLAEPGLAAGALTAAGLNLPALRDRLPRPSQEQPEPLDAEALASVGIDLDQVRRAAEARFGPGALGRAGPAQTRRQGRMRFTTDAKKALELAVRAAVGRRDREISGGHLLIGIIDQGHNGALDLLAGTGADAGTLRAEVLRRLSAAA